ncbi:MAG: DNA polymerase I [Vallitaleaceae bacterium]|nr:DNA polymerase I [Vallitaleaceae bacterium]
MNKSDKLLLIDGNSIMNRAFFGIRELTNSKGVHTNGIFGFLNILFKTIEEEEATNVVVAFDLKAPTFRHKLYDAYKGNRSSMPDELREQMPLIKSLLKKMNISICEIEGYEADDVLGTLAYMGQGASYEVTLLSGDKDMLQLATKHIKINIPKTSKGQTTTESYYDQEVMERYNVTPKEFIDVKGLMGDSSDNIPGVAGIGEKTASKLIHQYKTIEGVYEHLSELTPNIAGKLEGNYDIALLSRELATIKLDCEVALPLGETKIEEMFNEEAYHVFKELELKTFYNRFAIEDSVMEEVINDITIIPVENQAVFYEAIKKADELCYDLYIDEGFVALTLYADEKVYYADQVMMQVDQLFNIVSAILDDDSKEVITYNLKSQLHHINYKKMHLNLYDLSVVGYLINPNTDTYGIDDLVSEYMNQSYLSLIEKLGKGKSNISMNLIDETERMNYLSLGTFYLKKLAQIMKASLADIGMEDLYMEIELPLLYVLKSMESVGIKVDVSALKAYQSMLGAKIELVETEIYKLAGENFNINSPKQLGVILFEKLNLPMAKKTKTGYSTAVGVLEKLMDKHPIIDQVMSYRTLAKLKSTYADGLFNYISSDGRIHTTYSQKTAATGRLSSVDPNLQNIPIRLPIGREIRKVFVPKEGYVFVDADDSQIELRLLAHLSGDETFIKAFNDGEDIHAITAAKVFHVPYEAVTTTLRRNAKAVNFGIVYGISPYGLSQDLNIPVKEAANYIEQYFEKYPKVKSFLDKTVSDAKERGYTTTMYDRVRPIPELSSSNFMQRAFGERIAMNTPIQGSAADIMKVAMINVYKRLDAEKLDANLILQVHDELVIEVKEALSLQVQQLLIEEMEQATHISVPLTVDAHIGKNWYDAK